MHNCLLITPQKRLACPVYLPDTLGQFAQVNFYSQGPRPSLLAAQGRIISGIPNRLNNCGLFKAYTQYTNVAVGRTTEPGGPQAGVPWSKLFVIVSQLAF